MSSLTFTLGGTTFAGSGGQNTGWYALQADFPNEEHDLKLTHPPGTTGKQIVDCGSIGADSIKCRGRYIGASPAAAFAAFESLIATLTATSFSAVSPGGSTYLRCRLVKGGARVVRQPIATGRSNGQVLLEAEFTFDSHGGKQ